MILKAFTYLLLCVITSLFLFPFELVGLPGLNTKMMLAAIGLVVFFIETGRGKSGIVDRDMLLLSLFAVLVSLAGLAAIVYNGTNDTAYASYIVSMWVWIGAAYFVVWCIGKAHGYTSVRLVCNYLIVVCVFQCAMALWIDASPDIKQTVDAYIEQGQEFLNSHNVRRMYGIGASLDVAGTRFAVVLILLAFTLMSKDTDGYFIPIYFTAFIFIAVVGNMVARTTLVGLIIAFAYIIYKTKSQQYGITREAIKFWYWAGLLLAIIIPVTVYFYNVDADFHKNLRFGFEGFFNLVENGKWEISSNEKLKTMYVFPDNLKTWIIGDGYFDNPTYSDPYYTGKHIKGFYMGTDVGYLRFIFYFGLIGLSAFILFIIKAFKICYDRFAGVKDLFVMLFLLNMIIWFKVSTDIFLIFALFLMTESGDNVLEGKGELSAE